MIRSGRLLPTGFAFLALAFFLSIQSAFCQAVSGNIVGTVSDPSGAAVPSVQVVIRDLDRGVDYRVQTNSTGNYLQTHLLAGHYRVTVDASGFEKFVADLTVQVDASTRVDAHLVLGKSTSTVVVTGETPLLKTDRADVSNTLSSTELESLPALNRNLTELVLAMPGAQQNGWAHAASENPQAGLQIDANGQIFTSNGFLLDGTENESPLLGIAVINPNMDSLQEFKVTTSNYDAEFGSVSGALLQATTKSGTNQFHGTLFEFLRNDIFNSADPFTQLNPPFQWNQFGGSIGGPIKKDKLFFFGDFQGTRRRTGASLVTTVPTAAERSGNLQGLLGSYICADGTTSNNACANPVMVQTTQGTQVPAQAGMVFDPNTGNADGTGRQAISTGGQVNVLTVPAPLTKILGYLPLPNTGSAGQIVNNYIASGSELYDDNQSDMRLDYNMSEKSHFFGRYTISTFLINAPGAFGDIAGGPALNGLNFAGSSHARNQSLALGYTYTLSPTLVADFRFGAFRYRVRVDPNGVGTTPATSSGLPGLNLGTIATSGMPAFYVNGNGGFNFGYALGVNQCNCPLSETENQFQWVSNWTKEYGNHAIKWGADVRRDQQQRIPSDSHRSGEITFADAVTGNATVDAIANGNATTGAALASFLLGQPSAFARYFTGSGFYPGLRQTRLFLYGQDSWRVTPKLTLNYGLRWEDYLPQTAAKPGGAGSFDPNTGQVLAAGIGSVPLNMGVVPFNLGFAPRFGIDYQAQSNTVLRGGYGWSYTPSGLGSVFGQAPEYDPPILIPQTIPQSGPYASDFNLLAGPPFPTNPPIGSNGRYPLPDGIGVDYFFNPPSSFRIPMAYFWNTTIQHEFSNNLSFQVAYVGNVGRHIFLNNNINQAIPGPGPFDSRRPLYPKFGLEQGIYQDCNCANSSYNSLQAELQKHASHGLDFMLTYTYSKAMDYTETGPADNNYNWRPDYGPASWDRTHALTLTNVWQLPYGHGRRFGSNSSKVADAILGGWSLDGVTTLDSGFPFTPNVSNTASVNADFNNVRPDIIGNPIVSNQSAALWFNPAAYTDPRQLYRDGTASRDSLWGPAMYVFNLALAKTFVISETKRLEFRWENYNAFNADNLGLPNNIVDISGAGQITSTQVPMRQMQIGLHLFF
ncbi:MAG TPA: TonB-dependent receptor [Terriglobia bacterium]|nr:TonB-dependent receptor [Terriglobia bacterium]